MKYDPNFLDDVTVQLPRVRVGEMQLGTLSTLHYRHFDILYSSGRRLPLATAVNINGETYQAHQRKGDSWRFEKILPEQEQTGDEFYSLTNAAFHRGHIVRRLDPSWGNIDEATAASDDTFHFTNCCPQLANFNPRIWLELERNLLEKGSIAHSERIIVLSGPVLSPSDKPYIKPVNGLPFFIPERYWKIAIWKKLDGRLYAVGFVMQQPADLARHLDHNYNKATRDRKIQDQFENIKFKKGGSYQVTIAVISELTGLDFDLSGIIQPAVPDSKTELKVDVVNTKPERGYFRHDQKDYLSIGGMILS